ncbi:MAG: hypothetical protein M3O55_10335 [Actinomycetota bacterium]|nr:hypothetical protein [Actinomycetota bacterium]
MEWVAKALDHVRALLAIDGAGSFASMSVSMERCLTSGGRPEGVGPPRPCT